MCECVNGQMEHREGREGEGPRGEAGRGNDESAKSLSEMTVTPRRVASTLLLPRVRHGNAAEDTMGGRRDF